MFSIFFCITLNGGMVTRSDPNVTFRCWFRVSKLKWQLFIKRELQTKTSNDHRNNAYRKFNLSFGHTSAETVHCASVVAQTQPCEWRKAAPITYSKHRRRVFGREYARCHDGIDMTASVSLCSCNVHPPTFLISSHFEFMNCLSSSHCFTYLSGWNLFFSWTHTQRRLAYAISSIFLSFSRCPLSDHHPLLYYLLPLWAFDLCNQWLHLMTLSARICCATVIRWSLSDFNWKQSDFIFISYFLSLLK